jgi:hypothetical protein
VTKEIRATFNGLSMPIPHSPRYALTGTVAEGPATDIGRLASVDFGYGSAAWVGVAILGRVILDCPDLLRDELAKAEALTNAAHGDEATMRLAILRALAPLLDGAE